MQLKLFGKVVQVLVASRPDSKASIQMGVIEVIRGQGVENDRHAGQSRRVDVRESAMLEFGFSKGVEIVNHRQFSAISEEELGEITNALGLAAVPYGCLSENLVIRGIPKFSQLPIGTMLFFHRPDGQARSAVLVVWDENKPCRLPGEEIQKHFPNVDDVAQRFARAAINRRGIVGTVYCSGTIHQGDQVIAILPSRITQFP